MFFALPFTTHAIRPDEGSGLCRSIYLQNSWEYTRDLEVEKIAREILAQAGSHFIPVVCMGEGGHYALAGSKRMVLGGKGYYVLGFNREFRERVGVHLRGVIAHEVGHMGYPDGHCNGRAEGEYTACELMVDKAGERLVGMGVIASTHDAVIRFIEENRVPPNESDTAMLRTLRARRDALRGGK